MIVGRTTDKASAGIEFGEFCSGFPGVALGGYVAGALAARLPSDRPVEVTLRRPVPVGVELRVITSAEAVRLEHGGDCLAEATSVVAAEFTTSVPRRIEIAEAARASKTFWGFGDHEVAPQRHCYGCGAERAEGDGLRVFPGPTEPAGLVAGTWTPSLPDHAPGDPVPVEVVAAVLDCPAIWSLIVAAPRNSADSVVSGRFVNQILGTVRVGETYVVQAWPIDTDGRRRRAGAAVCGPDGSVLAHSVQTCWTAAFGVPLGPDRWMVSDAHGA